MVIVATGVCVTTLPASARPNCAVSDPPPICSGVIDPVVRLPDLVASVSGPTSATGGSTAVYAARVTNSSSLNGATARGVSVRITASGATIAAVSSAGWTCSTAGAVATCSGGTLTNAASASLPVTVHFPVATASVSITVSADPGGAITERSETNNTALVRTSVTAPALPDLQTTLSGPASVRGLYAAGVWTITVTNAGSAVATPVNVSWLTNWRGDVNANAVIRGAIGFTCIVPPEYMQQMVYCYGDGALQPGASATIVITAVPPAPGDVYGTAGVSTVTATADYGLQVSESNESNNAASVVSTILP
nr:CARDB domain-containing protein [Microbacterium bovistercoris]